MFLVIFYTSRFSFICPKSGQLLFQRSTHKETNEKKYKSANAYIKTCTREVEQKQDKSRKMALPAKG